MTQKQERFINNTYCNENNLKLKKYQIIILQMLKEINLNAKPVIFTSDI